jgi:selenocysteine lyase/cysteine desulfurase
MNIDLLAAPGHKGLYGPQGTGFLYIAEDIVLKPLLVGGTGSGSSELIPPVGLPERYESGTHNVAGIAGLKAGVDFIAAQGIEKIQRHEMLLVCRLIAGLSLIHNVQVFNSDLAKPRGSVVSFTVKGFEPATIGFILDRDFDIAVRVGLHCAPLAHRTIGTFPEGTVRVSPGIFNTAEDIDCLLAAVNEIATAKTQGALS